MARGQVVIRWLNYFEISTAITSERYTGFHSLELFVYHRFAQILYFKKNNVNVISNITGLIYNFDKDNIAKDCIKPSSGETIFLLAIA